MKRVTRLIALNLFCFVLVTSGFAQDYAVTGRFVVKESVGQWTDAERGSRSVPWKLYLPDVGDQKIPCVIFSHGLGGNREGNAVLGRHLASHGIAALHLQHVCTDRAAFRKNPRTIGAAVNDPMVSENRFRDIRFAVDTLKRLAEEDSAFQSINSDLLGISGHSLGGITALVVGGQDVKGFGQTLAVPEFKGAFVLSPSPPREGFGDAEAAFDKMQLPVFHATGTKDNSPDRTFKPTDRSIPFEKISHVDQWMMILNDATHFTFSGNEKMPGLARFIPGMEKDQNLSRNHKYLKMASLAFWRAILMKDVDARQFLSDGGLGKSVGKNGTVKFKSKRRR